MNQEETKPFSTVLDGLFLEEQVSIPLLYRLSDLSAEELAQFLARWPTVPEERRRVIARHMADLYEDNYVVDFVPLFAHFIRDEAASVREAALDGMWDVTDVSLVDDLIRLVQRDESVAVRTAAVSALAHYILMAQWGQLPTAVAPPIVKVLLVEYEKAETAVSVKRAALEALGASNHPRVATLIKEAYESGYQGLQLSAVFAMGNSADEVWLPVIMAEMSSDEDEMRAEAARAAGSIGSSDTIPALARLAVDENRDVSLIAITALGQIGGELAREVLMELADDPDYEDLYEVIDEAIDEMSWLSSEFDLLSLPDDDDDDDDDDLRYLEEMKDFD